MRHALSRHNTTKKRSALTIRNECNYNAQLTKIAQSLVLLSLHTLYGPILGTPLEQDRPKGWQAITPEDEVLHLWMMVRIEAQTWNWDWLYKVEVAVALVKLKSCWQSWSCIGKVEVALVKFSVWRSGLVWSFAFEGLGPRPRLVFINLDTTKDQTELSKTSLQWSVSVFLRLQDRSQPVMVETGS